MGNKIKNRIGEINFNKNGNKMIIYEYRKWNDIDILFPKYNYIVKSKTYHNFKTGYISCPLEIKNKSRNKINGDLITWKEGNLNYYNLDKLKEYLIKNPDKCTSKEEFCKKLNVYKDFFDNVEKIENIKFKYNFYVNSNNSIHFKAIYQNYDWCYKKYMIEGLNYDDMAKECNCSKRVIKKWCSDKYKLNQKYRQIHKQLSNIQKDLIIGSILGDGHIDKRQTQPMFIVSHAINQKDYLFWKYEILKDFCNTPPTYYKESTRIFNGKEYKCQPFYRFCTRIHNCLIPLRGTNKADRIKLLTKFSLSILMLDDGCRDKSNWSLCLADVSDKERNLFIYLMKNKFNLDCKINNYDKRYVNFTSNSSRQIDEIILENVPNNLDIIQDKIINKKISSEQKRLYIIYNDKLILLKDFCDKNCLNYKTVWRIFNNNKNITGEEILDIFNKGAI